ncbi:hypothetical protein [Paenibacillus larvae]|uniref:hypothetical protein n=1 Tax=Paenibacillus larvae TaxID=1464 RepID=UPI00227E3B42|nr:hypothetical protein [Paenibacillus larvae]MCY9679158.1 hypothetical protein [Paenibacillus larvae]MCY9747517.1 hypothetical protein [Paenibacillus larvae]
MSSFDHDAQLEALYLKKGAYIQYWFDSSSSSKHLVNVGVLRYPDYYRLDHVVVAPGAVTGDSKTIPQDG